jgi:hypothetical protein
VNELKKHKCATWLHVEDIPWALNYIADEVQVGGVPLESDCETPKSVGVVFDLQARAFNATAMSPEGKMCQRQFVVRQTRQGDAYEEKKEKKEAEAESWVADIADGLVKPASWG